MKPIVIGIVVWIAITVTLGAAISSHGLPFLKNLPLFADTEPIGVLIALQVGAIAGLVVAGLALLLTRKSHQQAQLTLPQKENAKHELSLLLGYLVLAQIGGYVIGKLCGIHPIGLHLSGTLYGLHEHVSQTETFIWMTYNFVIYALLPYLYFRSKGYTNAHLNLKSKNLKWDLLVILVVLTVEGTSQLGGLSHAIFNLSASQILIGGLLSFVINLFGTAIPIMIFVYALLLPRYLAVTKSTTTAILITGLTYAAMHILDSWTMYNTLSAGLMSIGFLIMQYFVPGVVKSILTVRTGNAWVSLWSYHAIAPHVLIDTPHFVEIFKVK